MSERWNESEIRAGGGHVDVAPRLVRFRFEREREAVLPIDRVLTQIVHRFAQPLDGFVGPTARVRFGPFAAAPQHEDARAELSPQVHRPHRLLDGVRAHARVIRRERAVAKHRIEEQVHRRHRHDDAVTLARAFEARDDAIALGRRGVDRHEIVVVQVHSPRACLREQRDGIVGRKRLANGVAERIAAAVADGPEAEGELVRRRRMEYVRHVKPPSRPAARRLLCREETDARTSPCQASADTG